MNISDMKRIYTLLTATLMLAGITLWSGCSNNEQIDSTTPETQVPQQANSFSFKLKGIKADTRADAEDVSTADEKAVYTMYVALFANNGTEDSKLSKIFCKDDAEVSENWQNLKIKESDGTYTITNPGYVGAYTAYFIANPDDDIKTQLATYLSTIDSESPTTLSAFEEGLVAGANTADGTKGKDPSKEVNTETNPKRGFIMVGKESINIDISTQLSDIALARLAARFDFINSAGASGNIAITKVEMNNPAIQSDLVQKTGTDVKYLNTTTPATITWEASLPQTGTLTTYTYENLNVTEGSAVNRTSITVYYTLKDAANSSDEVQKKKITITLNEGETQLAILRNHIYKIYLNGVTGQYTLEVADWGDGETVTIPNKDLNITYTANDLGKIGDFVYINDQGELAFFDGGLRTMYLDGSLSFTAPATLTTEQQKKCIGVVFSNMTSETDQKAGFSKGYVMALKYASENIAWGTAGINTQVAEQTKQIATIDECLNDYDGFSHCQEIANADPTFTNHPALAAIATYATNVPIPTDNKETTGWYLPSCGQISLICENLGGFSGIKSLKSSSSGKTSRAVYTIANGGDYMNKNIDMRLALAGSGNYDLAYVSSGIWTLTSTELPSNSSRNQYYCYMAIDFGNGKTFAFNGDGVKKTYTDVRNHTRAVFAF